MLGHHKAFGLIRNATRFDLLYDFLLADRLPLTVTLFLPSNMQEPQTASLLDVLPFLRGMHSGHHHHSYAKAYDGRLEPAVCEKFPQLFCYVVGLS